MGIPFEIQEHTADVRLHVIGATYQDLLQNALLGLVSFVVGEVIIDQGSRGTYPFDIISTSPETLLVDFLNEALFILQTKKLTPFSVQFDDVSEKCVKGKFVVYPTRKFMKDVKAVTYHDVHIQKTQDGKLEITLVFDI